MVNIQQYPSEVRERALQLVEEGNSYSRVVQKLKEEFAEKYPEVEKISKSTIYRWVAQHRKQEKAENEVAEEKKEEPREAPQRVEKAAAVSENLPSQLGQLPRIHPDQVVADLNREVTEVPPGPLIQKAEKAQEAGQSKEEPEKEGIMEKIKKLEFLRSKVFWSVTLTLVIGAVILWLIKRHTSRREEEVEEEEPEERPTPKKKKDEYLEVRADEEDEDGAISALDLPF